MHGIYNCSVTLAMGGNWSEVSDTLRRAWLCLLAFGNDFDRLCVFEVKCHLSGRDGELWLKSTLGYRFVAKHVPSHIPFPSFESFPVGCPSTKSKINLFNKLCYCSLCVYLGVIVRISPDVALLAASSCPPNLTSG